MADIVTAATRSRMMAGIRGRDTKPELVLRHGLHRLGFRFRLHVKDMPGKPDIVFPKYSAVIFANGCFWHGHECELFRWPATRPEFWRSKISGNVYRDKKTKDRLIEAGWRVLTVWECAFRGSDKRPAETVIMACSKWLKGDRPVDNINGRNT